MSSSSSSSTQNPQQGENLMWVEKYRPNSLEDLLANGEVMKTRTGKTSTILAVAKQMYQEKFASYNTLELNASDERGIQVIREKIKTFASTGTLFAAQNTIKLIILDEADHMTKDAQAALRRVIEQYTSTTRFCIICNYVNKIIPAIQSRCMRFRFEPLKKDLVVERLAKIAEIEGMKITKQALATIFKVSCGDMRKCVHILQSCHMSYHEKQQQSEISEDDVFSITGKPTNTDIRDLFNELLKGSFESSRKKLENLQETKGVSLKDILQELYPLVFNLDGGVDDLDRAFLIEKFSDIEARLASGTQEKIQASALISAFAFVRDAFVQKKSGKTDGIILDLEKKYLPIF